MFKKLAITSLLISTALLVTNCVSPYYSTAQIEPGWNINVGAGLHSTAFIALDAGPVYGVGLRCDSEIGYGVNRYFKPYARGAVGLNTACPYFGDVGIGFQSALPLGKITPALRIEVNSTGVLLSFAPALLLGFGKKEVLTLGVRPQFVGFDPEAYDLFIDALAIVHISPRMSIFAGAELNSLIEFFDEKDGIPFLCVGVGYKLPPFHLKTD
ncbi:hypothetical protein JXM67_05070 [candidate division WOR-3 bacterium]|nr:hypothetical protein [candidate division WOR-3 bacterium]